MRTPPRKHLVLVPGFVGFDMLGQVGYYAGVTRKFQEWLSEGAAAGIQSSARRAESAIHYFDNFPTASVAMRGERLRKFLAKRIARGEIALHDEVTLLGHSTGGLDIRQLLADLMLRHATTETDGLTFTHEQVLAPIRRAVFISVPQYGTNLADFLVGYRPTVQAFLRDIAAGVAANKSPITQIRQKLAALVAPRSDLLLAIADSLNESDQSATTEAQLANEREARAALSLWLEHMIHDFSALEDLTSWSDKSLTQSPAHLSKQDRQAELARYAAHGIRTQSYATRVDEAQNDTPGFVSFGMKLARWAVVPLNAWHGALNTAQQWYVPFASREVAETTRVSVDSAAIAATVWLLHAQPATPFLYGYAACASGPFQDPSAQGEALADTITVLTNGSKLSRASIATADNDGIVNTLSMLWPPSTADAAHETFLVNADHADVIGHFALSAQAAPKTAERDRVYDAYDIFLSGSGFDAARFDLLWRSIFRFAFPED